MKKYFIVILTLFGITSYSYCDYEFEYIVKKGDTLWGIAVYELNIDPLDFSNFVEEVKQSNPWIKDDNFIYSDRKLKLSREVNIKYAASDNIKTDAIIESPEKTKAPSESYIIQKGDSLWNILSNRYNLMNPKKLREIVKLCLEMNPSIKNPDILWIGEKILLPENMESGKIESVVSAGTIQNEPLQNILNEAENKSPEEVDKLFWKMQDYQLVKNSLIVISFGRYELKVKADRLLIPQNVTAENKQEYLINYVTSPSKRTSIHLKNLLKEKSYILVEIIVK
ncbi:MAG: LysM peptidoglycan-binding domain-containing protein [bacterium]